MSSWEAAPGVYRLGTRWANFYLVVEESEALLVDAGYPRYWAQLPEALGRLGLARDALRGVIVTHHHVDHAGSAERIRSERGAVVFVHKADRPKVTGQQRSHVPTGFYRESWRPSMMRYLAHSARVGGARYRPVREAETLTEERKLDLPGRPRVVPTPGHTAGHCSVVLEESGVLLAGDALVNFDYASGHVGLNLHRFNEDRAGAYTALDQLERFDVPHVVFGHGDPWTNGSRKAIERARAASAEEGRGSSAGRAPP